jgi:hypothetical protein
MTRVRRLRCAAGTAIVVIVLVGTGRLEAQTLPLPDIPPPLPTVPAPGQPAWEQTRRWEYAIGLGAGYDSNPASTPQGLGDALATPLGALVRVVPGTKGQLRIRGSGVAYLYAEQRDWSRVDADLSAEGTRALSRRATWNIDFSAEIKHTDNNPILDQQGVALGLSRTNILQGSTDVGWEIGTHGTVRAGGRVFYGDFVDPLLVDSRSARVFLSLGRRVSERSTLYARYDFETSWLETEYSSHFGSLQLNRVLSSRSAVLLEGGASYSDVLTTSGLARTWNPYGGASFNWRGGPSSVVAYARSEVVPAFGVGGLWQVYRFGLQLSVPLGRAWLDIDGSHANRSASGSGPEGNAPGEESVDEASLVLRKRVGRRSVVAMQARYRHLDHGPSAPSISSVRAALVLVLSNPGAGGI